MAKVTFDYERCKGCGLCAAACPKKIVTLGKTNAKGFHTPALTDTAACIGCAFCALMCPDAVIGVEKEAV